MCVISPIQIKESWMNSQNCGANVIVNTFYVCKKTNMIWFVVNGWPNIMCNIHCCAFTGPNKAFAICSLTLCVRLHIRFTSVDKGLERWWPSFPVQMWKHTIAFHKLPATTPFEFYQSCKRLFNVNSSGTGVENTFAFTSSHKENCVEFGRSTEVATRTQHTMLWSDHQIYILNTKWPNW